MSLINSFPGIDISDKQSKTLSTPIMVDIDTETTVEGALNRMSDELSGSNFIPKTFSGIPIEYTEGLHVWNDGENVYWSDPACNVQKVLNKATSTWTDKTWTGMTSFDGKFVWSDGVNVYYSEGTTQKVLDKSTSTWSDKTWTGLTDFSGLKVWTDGKTIYYSSGSDYNVYILDVSTSSWSEETWTGQKASGVQIWTDGTDIYYSYGSAQKVLDRSQSAWVNKTWTGVDTSSLNGENIWSDGKNIYLTYYETQKVLDKANSTWVDVNWDVDIPLGYDVWTDGSKFYYSGLTRLDVAEYGHYEYINSAITNLDRRVSNLESSVSDLSFYLEQTVTLSTSAETTVTFTDSRFTANSCVEPATPWGIVPTNVVTANGSCTVTLPKVDSAQTISVRVYLR